MQRSLVFQLQTGETILEQDKILEEGGIQFASLYSVVLTDRRAIFRYSGISSSYSLAFGYDEIQSVAVTRRLFVDYLQVVTAEGGYLINIGNPAYWVGRITEMLTNLTAAPRATAQPVADPLQMLEALERQGLLGPDEIKQAKQKLGTAPAGPAASGIVTLPGLADAVTNEPLSAAAMGRIEALISAASARRTPLACLVMAVDQADWITETYGEEQTEHVMKDLVAAVQPQCRTHDVLLRYQRTRLLLLHETTGQEGTVELANRLRGICQGRMFSCQSENLKITLSVGSTLRPAGATMDLATLIGHAATACSQAKASGGNQTVVE